MINDIFIYDDSFLDLATVQKIQEDVIHTKPFFYAKVGGAQEFFTTFMFGG